MWSEQAFCFVSVKPHSDIVNIDDIFQQTIPQTPYEDEMDCLAWIDQESLADMSNVSRSIRALQPILLNINL